MANIKLNLPAAPFTGQIVNFPAPCGCDEVTDGLSINGEIYTVVDAMGECVTGKGGAWCSGAQVSVVLDVENKKAYIQNNAQGAKIASGSYVGTGKSGKNNPNSLTFDFAPKMVMMLGYTEVNASGNPSYHALFGNAFDPSPVSGGYGYTYRFVMTPALCTEDGGLGFALMGKNEPDCSNVGRVTNGGRTFEWYSVNYDETVDASSEQLNKSGVTYHYLAIG